MSGIEIAGLIVGALPLMISAMEHYEETRRMTVTWWKIRRAHRRDLGRLRDCRLKFQLNMKDLLLPLVIDGIIKQDDCSTFLSSPNDPGWNRAEVQEALDDRLCDCRIRYLEVLGEMELAIKKLAKATMVDDQKFQAFVNVTRAAGAGGSADQKLGGLVLSANDHIVFELQRLAYSFTISNRERLIDEVERHNTTLGQYLAMSDRIAKYMSSPELASTARVKRKFRCLLSFSTHADSVYGLIKGSWNCPCSVLHCACLRLRDRTSMDVIDLELLMRYTSPSGQQSIGSWDRKPLRVTLTDQSRDNSSVSFQGVAGSLVEGFSGKTLPKSANMRSVSGQVATMTLTATSPALVREPQKQMVNISDQGLCHLAEVSQGSMQLPLGVLKDDTTQPPRQYEVFHAKEQTHDKSSLRLCELFKPDGVRALLRAERISLAFILASSFLQLFPTSWMPSLSSSNDIRLPIDTTMDQILYSEPYVLVGFQDFTQPGLEDSTFVELGIILLELCFNKTFSEHALWRQLTSSSLPLPQSLIRKVVASEWCKDVQLEADAHYASAVEWCLHRATVRDIDWKIVFAQRVVQPLHKCYNTVMIATKAAA